MASAAARHVGSVSPSTARQYRPSMDWLSAAAADWGNVPGWIAVGFSAIAIGISHASKRASSRSAAASERSAAAAEQSAANGKRSADTAAEALKLQQQAAQPKVKLTIQSAARGVYRLQNEGDAPAVGLTLIAEDEDQVLWQGGPPASPFPRGDSSEFVIANAANPPTRLRFTWVGQADPVHVAIP